MKKAGIFDVLGPCMIGPSSSHTAGACAIANLAARLAPGRIRRVTFTLYGSFARTYAGHGTDRALVGGILGFRPDDPRLRDAFAFAEKAGLVWTLVPDRDTRTAHPNTVDIRMETDGGRELTVRGESIGGGRVRIVKIGHVDVDFTGEYPTLIVRHVDRPGTVAHITQCLAACHVNIAFMRVFREKRGETAYAVVESDEPIPAAVLAEIDKNPNVRAHTLIDI